MKVKKPTLESIQLNVQTIRENCKNAIRKRLILDSSVLTELSPSAIENLEKTIFNFSVRLMNPNTPMFVGVYKTRAKTILACLESDPGFVEKIRCIDPWQFKSIVTESSMFQLSMKAKRIRDNVLEMQENNRVKSLKSVEPQISGMHKCRCGSKRIYSYSYQLKSGDENMSCFFFCEDCKCRWKTG